MRLIDADKLATGEDYCGCVIAHDGDAYIKVKDLIGYIEQQPTIEAQPVVHGEWVEGCCTNCGAYIPTDSSIDFISEDECNYCYFCGADMRKKV